MYDNEGKKYRCINMCKNTKVNNECEIYENTKDRKRKKIRKTAKRREYCTKVAHTPVSSGSKCKKEYVVEYIGMRSYMKI